MDIVWHFEVLFGAESSYFQTSFWSKEINIKDVKDFGQQMI